MARRTAKRKITRRTPRRTDYNGLASEVADYLDGNNLTALFAWEETKKDEDEANGEGSDVYSVSIYQYDETGCKLLEIICYNSENGYAHVKKEKPKEKFQGLIGLGGLEEEFGVSFRKPKPRPKPKQPPVKKPELFEEKVSNPLITLLKEYKGDYIHHQVFAPIRKASEEVEKRNRELATA